MKFVIALLCLSLASFANAKSAAPVQTFHYTILKERSHKPSLFTQGLLIDKDRFYESSGLYNKSMLVTYPIAEPASTWAQISAPFLQKQTLPDRYFAEGLTEFHGALYLLTWLEGSLFVYDKEHLSLTNTLYYKGQGWGLTHDEQYLIRSDGSNQLFFHNSNNFAVEKTLSVTLNQVAVDQLNELEYFEGFIWANIWHDNRIVKIDPHTGEVVGVLDLSDIVNSLHLEESEKVLNGIAYDAEKKAVWITGKQWPKMFLLHIQ